MLTPSATRPTVKCAIYRTSSIGDVVLATACVHLLRSLEVSYEVTWIGKGASAQLISSSFPEFKMVEVNPDVARYQDALVAALKGVHFMVDLQVSVRSHLVSRLLKKNYNIPTFRCDKGFLDRGRMVVGARLRGRRRSLPEAFQDVKVHQYEMMVEALKNGLKQHLPSDMHDVINNTKAHPYLDTSEDDGFKPWQKELKFAKWIAIAPGAAHDTKRAPQALFRDILESCQDVFEDKDKWPEDIGLIFLGDENDREEALSIVDDLNWRGPILNLAGKLSLWESALALKDASCVVSNDSSLAHIAEAVGTPAGILFGPTVEAFGFSPWREKSRAFSAPIGCRPCSKHGKAPCRYGDKLCFKLLSLKAVTEFVCDSLSSSGRES